MDEKIVTKEEVWAAFAQAEKEIAELRQVLAGNAEGMDKLEQQVDRTAREVEDTSKTVKAVTKQLGGMANSEGDAAEEYFANTLTNELEFAGQRYDFSDRKVHRKRQGREDEFDVLMYNGTSVAIIEVKYKADLDDVDCLVNRKLDSFRLFFPEYKNHRVYLGLGSMSFDNKVITKAHNLGIGILRQKGDIIEADPGNIRAY